MKMPLITLKHAEILIFLARSFIVIFSKRITREYIFDEYILHITHTRSHALEKKTLI